MGRSGREALAVGGGTDPVVGLEAAGEVGSSYSNLTSPSITAFEVEADHQAADTAAEHLLELTWPQMLDPRNPFYTGTFWENIGPDGPRPKPGPACRTAGPPAQRPS